MATAAPVPTSARCNGASSTSSATARSAPASPGRAYRGAVAPGELRRTGTSTSTGVGSGTPPTLVTASAAVAEVGQHPAGQVLGGLPVAATGDRRAQQERRGDGDPPRHAPGEAAAHGPQPGGADHRHEPGAGTRPVDGPLLGPAGQVGGRPRTGVAGSRPVVELVQLA